MSGRSDDTFQMSGRRSFKQYVFGIPLHASTPLWEEDRWDKE